MTNESDANSDAPISQLANIDRIELVADFQRAFAVERQFKRRKGTGWRSILDAVYTGLLLILIVGAPVWLALRDGAHSGVAVLGVIGTMPTYFLVLVLTPILAFGAIGLAPSLGPILGKPFEINLLTSLAIDRRAAFGLRIAKSAMAIFLGLALLASLQWSLTFASVANLLIALLFAICGSLIIIAAWMFGLMISPLAARLILTVAFCLFVALLAAVPPRDWVPRIVPTSLSPWDVFSVVILSALAGGYIWFALPQINGQAVMASAHRWQRIVASSSIGDFSSAQGEFAMATGIGRRWAVPRVLGWWGTAAWLALFRFARVPWRIIWLFALSTLSLLLFIAAPPAQVGSMGVPLWAGGLAGLAQYFAFALFSSQLQFATSMVLPPKQYGGSALKIITAHLVIPALALVLANGIAAGLVFALSGGQIQVITTLLWSLAMLPINALIAVHSAFKREPPLILTIPIASPMGDPSALHRLIWQFDYLFIIPVAGVLMHLLITAGNPLATGVAILVFAIYLGFGIQRRYRRSAY